MGKVLRSSDHARAVMKPRPETDVWGCTALHRVAHVNDSLEVRSLLEQGFDPDVRDIWDETPLHMAARSGEIEAARELLAFGADINARNANDKTPLVEAAEAGHELVCAFLLDRGATAGGLEDQDIPALLSLLMLQRMTVDCTTWGSAMDNVTEEISNNDYEALCNNHEDKPLGSKLPSLLTSLGSCAKKDSRLGGRVRSIQNS